MGLGGFGGVSGFGGLGFRGLGGWGFWGLELWALEQTTTELPVELSQVGGPLVVVPEVQVVLSLTKVFSHVPRC